MSGGTFISDDLVSLYLYFLICMCSGCLSCDVWESSSNLWALLNDYNDSFVVFVFSIF